MNSRFFVKKYVLLNKFLIRFFSIFINSKLEIIVIYFLVHRISPEITNERKILKIGASL
jgi:hypothetical protein